MPHDRSPFRNRMMNNAILTRLLAIALGVAAVAICYFYVDRPLALFMHEHRFLSDAYYLWPALLSDWLTYAVIAGMIGVAIWRFCARGGRQQTLLVAIVANLLATYCIKCVLKWTFGRTWPETWIRGNPSLITGGVYGFHPFHYGTDYQSFPSGHAAATFAVISILWLSRPRGRWLYGFIAAAVCMSLVGMNYHFAGDVIAGAMLGTITGCYATRFFQLRSVSPRA